jgi:hypothetical protein
MYTRSACCSFYGHRLDPSSLCKRWTASVPRVGTETPCPRCYRHLFYVVEVVDGIKLANKLANPFISCRSRCGWGVYFSATQGHYCMSFYYLGNVPCLGALPPCFPFPYFTLGAPSVPTVRLSRLHDWFSNLNIILVYPLGVAGATCSPFGPHPTHHGGCDFRRLSNHFCPVPCHLFLSQSFLPRS